jgi:zinc transporter ZupT
VTRTATQGLIMSGAFILLLVVVAATFVDMDRQGVRGTAVGAALGLLNLAVGYLVTRRTLRRGMKSAMAMVAGGFIARLAVLVSLMVVFQRTGAADPAAFALTFLVFFFVYLAVEVLLVERSLDGRRSTV